MDRRFGIELECVGLPPRQVADLLNAARIPALAHGYQLHGQRNYNDSLWKITTDATISNRDYSCSCEVVSPPLSKIDYPTIRKVLEVLNDAGCGVNRSCGFHVHIEAKGWNKRQIMNIVTRYALYRDQIDALMPPSRRAANAERWIRPLEKRIYSDSISFANWDRYHTVNVHSHTLYGTIEFRQHSGTLNASKVINWIEFLFQFCENSLEDKWVGRPSINQNSHNSLDRALFNVIKHLQQYGEIRETSIRECCDEAGYYLRGYRQRVNSEFMIMAELKSRYGLVYRRKPHSNLYVSQSAYNWSNRTTINRLIQDAENPEIPYSNTGTDDDLWRGIDEGVKTFYRNRMRALNTGDEA